MAFFIGIGSDRILIEDTTVDEGEIELATAEGYAVVHGTVGVEISDGKAIRSGDVLGADTVALEKGSVRIDFFSGAQIYLEGPAELEVRSAWEAELRSGKMRANVPPAARGFIVESNGRRIVDLGTEFGVDTNAEEVKVEVFSGKIELEDRELVKGEAVSLTRDGKTTPIGSSIESFSSLFSIASGLSDSTKASFRNWLKYSDELSRDSRLIGYYPFKEKIAGNEYWVPSGIFPEDGELDGAAVLAEWVDGRWGSLKGAMEFRRPGARVRVNIPGEFSAFTFACWARIDSLDRRYNALFLADSFQQGEPHWQIRNDGVLMIGILVDDDRPKNAQMLDASRQNYRGPWANRNYFSPSIWDMSMSGQWLHLASVYDPANRRVAHYVEGEMVSEHYIEDDYFVETLKIGNGEIGNWGQPFRKDPEFAIRNLNGRIGELAIFDAALTGAEIAQIYSKGRE
ncbi:MAG: LamG-like jellyroll fold domain-containing protein [Verrucomicrobiota bacterium]